ncbi:MAG: PAS domain-containing protein [Gracilimonas sp.]|nr:PAS domain-containing protein [Gracilimonas sp.]
MVFSTDGEMIRWNDILEEDLGYSARELARSNVFNLIHPDDRYKLKDILNGELVGKKVSVELRCISKDGMVVNYLYKGTSFQQHGKTYIVGGGLNQNDFLEIESERKRNAELLTQLFNNSPIGIVLIDADGNILDSNNSFEKTFEYGKEELQNLTLAEAIVPDFMDKQAQAFSTQGFTGESVFKLRLYE